jgi:UDP-2,3-diacylglucosamine pyrophosphatase LpxH
VSATHSPDLLLVSDLHLGCVGARGRWHQAAFADFLVQTREEQRARDKPWRLILLGDVFDFSAVAAPVDPADSAACVERARTVLDRVTTEAPDALVALRGLLTAGVPIDLVVGNHDSELADARIQGLLLERLLGRNVRDVPLRFHPWILYVPGRLYAEHGSQHHDINRVPCILGKTDLLAAGATSAPGAVLGRSQRLLRERITEETTRKRTHVYVEAVVAVGRSVLSMGSGDGKRLRERYFRQVLPHHADAIGLPTSVLESLDCVSNASIVGLVRRLAGRTLRRFTGTRGDDDFMQAARRIHAVLDGQGAAAAVYAFGHSHDVQCRRLLHTVDSPLYVNAGTWSPFVRGEELRRSGRHRPTWIRINASGEVTLGRWDGVQATPDKDSAVSRRLVHLEPADGRE